MSINKFFKDELLILKKFPINENDLLVNAYGKFSGKIQLKAKGAKKIRSKFTGRLEPFQMIEAEIYNSGKSLTITQANLKREFLNIPFTLENFLLQQKICLLINKIVQYNEQSNQLFQLLYQTLHGFKQQNSPQLLENFFLTKLLDISGILPEFTHCHLCNQKLSAHSYFTPQSQLICSSCSSTSPLSSQLLTFNTIKWINYLKNSTSILSCYKIKIPSSNSQEATSILDQFLTDLLKA